MPVEKFSVSLPEDLVRDLDEIAAVDGLTRSAVIREVAAEYVAARKSGEYEAARRARVDCAIAGFDDIAATWGEDDESGLHRLRQLRREATGAEPADE